MALTSDRTQFCRSLRKSAFQLKRTKPTTNGIRYSLPVHLQQPISELCVVRLCLSFERGLETLIYFPDNMTHASRSISSSRCRSIPVLEKSSLIELSISLIVRGKNLAVQTRTKYDLRMSMSRHLQTQMTTFRCPQNLSPRHTGGRDSGPLNHLQISMEMCGRRRSMNAICNSASATFWPTSSVCRIA